MKLVIQLWKVSESSIRSATMQNSKPFLSIEKKNCEPFDLTDCDTSIMPSPCTAKTEKKNKN